MLLTQSHDSLAELDSQRLEISYVNCLPWCQYVVDEEAERKEDDGDISWAPCHTSVRLPRESWYCGDTAIAIDTDTDIQTHIPSMLRT